MKLLLVIAALFASAAMAESPFLPIGPNNTFKSVERAQIESAIEQAETTGQFVLIDVAAAWCGPCMAMDQYIHDNAEKLQPTLDHFVYVHLEQMHFELIHGADFLPAEIGWFPSFYVYNPQKKSWTMLFPDGPEGFQPQLDQYLAQGGELAAPALRTLRAKINQGENIGLDEILKTILPMAVESDAADLIDILAEVNNALETHPEHFGQFTRDDYESNVEMMLWAAIAMGKVDVHMLQIADPHIFANYNGDVYTMDQFLFGDVIGRLVRGQGNRVASEHCEIVAQKAEDQMKAAAPDEDLSYLTLQHKLQCLMLRAQLGESSKEEVDALATSLDQRMIDAAAATLAVIYAEVGDFTTAIAYIQQDEEASRRQLGNASIWPRMEKAYADLIDAFTAGRAHP